MPEIILTGANERLPLNFEYISSDGTAKNLTGYTVTPIIYNIGLETVYKTGAAAGTIIWVDQAAGTYQFLPAVDIFVSGDHYNLRFKFVSGSETYIKGDFDWEYRVR